MPVIEIYSTKACPFCRMAKSLLDQKNAKYTEILVDADPSRMTEAVERSGGRRTVPQIFIDDQHVGGYDELNALDRKGGLDPLLGG
ncbi:MAG: glutaredoxin 3 [Desulfobacterales bacterium]|nr:glutaredoxin 3 [Desulfobacterales bacterium]